MRRTLLLAIFLIIPFGAWALDYSNFSLLYTDAPFRPGEAAGISLLTSLGAVEGNPDGSFAPYRTLNRAEFLKIALLSHPQIRVSLSDAERCFPDVPEDAWFSRYVCLAKKRDIISGYPDGTFRPEDPVNYAEALKILGSLYKYTAWSPPDGPWYQIYVQAAINHGTILPVNLPYDRPITRGQMARLASAYWAENEGELESYRDAEKGRYVRRVVAESELIEGVISSKEEEEPETEVDGVFPDLPSKSRFLILGERSEPIADGTFYPVNGPVRIRIVEVELQEEVQSLDALYLVDSEGNDIATLTLDRFDQEDETWRVDIEASDAYELPDRTGTTLALEARMHYPPRGGYPVEMIKVRKFKLTVEPVGDGQSFQLIPTNAHFPQHRTAKGRITEVSNALPDTGTFEAGNNQLLAAFSFSGIALSGTTLRIEGLAFDVQASDDVSVSAWELGAPDSSTRHICSVKSATRINCLDIPGNLGGFFNQGAILQLYGDVSLSESGQTLQILLGSPGKIGVSGAVRWGDGTDQHLWVELPDPLAEGTLWAN